MHEEAMAMVMVIQLMLFMENLGVWGLAPRGGFLRLRGLRVKGGSPAGCAACAVRGRAPPAPRS